MLFMQYYRPENGFSDFIAQFWILEFSAAVQFCLSLIMSHDEAWAAKNI